MHVMKWALKVKTKFGVASLGKSCSISSPVIAAAEVTLDIKLSNFNFSVLC